MFTPRQHRSIHPRPVARHPSHLCLRRKRIAHALILAGIASLLGALHLLCPLPSWSSSSSPHHHPAAPAYLTFPHSLAHFLPLLIPLTTYIVIARWTGEKHFRHS
ncbi:hypothetical protein ACQY0O_001000 [Thecaphora frezii]